MKANLRFLCLLIALLLLSACLPEERVWWSPKGDRALVSIDEKLHLVTADGELGPPLESGPSLQHSLVKTVSWLPDGSSLVCQRETLCKTWAEARALIPEDEAAAVEEMAPLVLPLLQMASTLASGGKSMDDISSILPVGSKKRFTAAMLRAYQTEAAPVEKLLLTLPDGKDILESFKGDDAGFTVGELCLFKLDGKKDPSRSWHRSLLKPPLAPKVSPGHDAVAYLTLDEKEEAAALEVLPMAGGPGMVVSQRVSAAFDWTPDGRSLVFMAPIGEKEETLQSIHLITVLQKDGSLIKPPADGQKSGGLPDAATLVTGIMLNRPVLQVLPDGRILFASQPASLPFVGGEPEFSPRLYVISADGKNLQPVPAAQGALPTDLGYFVASPDGRYVAVVESETDAVAVVELSTGKTQIISPAHPNWHCQTLPAWKSATELTFAALHGAANEPKWMLWSEKSGVRCISEKWPASATSEWVKYKKPDAEDKPVPVDAKPAKSR